METLPHNLEAEQAVLGCILLHPPSIAEAIEQLPDTINVFHDIRHQTIWSAMLDMFRQGKEISTITLMSYLRDEGTLDECGGISYLSQLPDATPSAVALDTYTEEIVNKYAMRHVVIECGCVSQKAQQSPGELDSVFDEVETTLQKLVAIRTQRKSRSMAELVKGSLENMDEIQSSGQMFGISSGFPNLDEMTCGMAPGDITIIAARPSVGKTAMACNIVEHLTINGLPVGFISLEMSSEQIVDRLICTRARVDSTRVRRGMLQQDEITRIQKAAKDLRMAPLHLDDQRGVTSLQIKSKLRSMASTHGIRVAVIDYIQLIKGRKGKDGSRAQEIAEISGDLKTIAGDLKIPLLVLAQLNRDMSKEKRPPVLSDLKDSGAIEQDADVVAMLHNTGESPSDGVNLVDLMLQKNRYGPTGVVRLQYTRMFTKFERATVTMFDALSKLPDRSVTPPASNPFDNDANDWAERTRKLQESLGHEPIHEESTTGDGELPVEQQSPA